MPGRANWGIDPIDRVLPRDLVLELENFDLESFSLKTRQGRCRHDDDSQEFLQIDLPAMTAAVLACVSCALVGNFLVLRRQSMLGDAISHAILPGIVTGFLVTGTRAGLPVILGALAAAVIAGVLIEAVRRLGRLDGGAAMGWCSPSCSRAASC